MSAAFKYRPVYALTALICSFGLSQALRTLPAIVAPGLEADLHISPQQIGYFAGAFHLAFGLMQLPVGVALDRFGPRSIASFPFALTALGSALCALSSRFDMLIFGQFLIGIGCAPALMGTFVFISRAYPPQRFAKLSGLVFALGGLGMLATGTPLALVIDHWSWRAGFVVLGVLAALCAVTLWVLLESKDDAHAPQRETFAEAIRGVGRVLRFPQTAGMLALGLVSYSSVLTLRSLWIVPLFAHRHGLDLVAIGNIILAMSLAMIVGPTLYGLIDPGPRRRPAFIVTAALTTALCPALLALSGPTWSSVALTVAFGAVSSYQVLQYAQVRDTYPTELSGRALSTLNMAAFLGIAIMQGASGMVAGWAEAHGHDLLVAVCALLAAALTAGALTYAFLPRTPR